MAKKENCPEKVEADLMLMMFSAFFFRFGNKGEKWSGSRLRKLFQCWKSQQFTFLPQYERKSPKWRDAKTCQFSSKKTIHSLRYDTSQITVQKKKKKKEKCNWRSVRFVEKIYLFFLGQVGSYSNGRNVVDLLILQCRLYMRCQKFH